MIAATKEITRWGSRTQAGKKLEAMRPFLRGVAQAEMSPPLCRRVEPSDVVQQTLLEAYARREQFAGGTEREWTEWLRRILQRNIYDVVRGLRRKKRDINREQPLPNHSADSTSPAEDWLAAGWTSPSQKLMASEELQRISLALAGLPEDQREAVVLHHLQGLTLNQLAEHFGRHPSAVAGLLHRGLKKLRQTLRAN